MRRVLQGIFLLSAISCGNRSAMCQWQLLAGTSGGSVSSIYFQDAEGRPSLGFAGYTKGGIIRTTNRGRTWAPVTINIKATGGTLGFTFKDSLMGWAAIGAGILVTTDGGSTWNPTSFAAECHCVYYHKAKQLLFGNSPLAYAKVSTDYGVTWDDYGPRRLLGMAFTNDTLGIETSFDDSYRFTTDGGRSWTNSDFIAECWQPFGVKGTKIFLAASETFIGTDLLYRSTDGGQTWHYLFSFYGKARLAGSISGDARHLYVQSDAGIYVSNDTGKNWKYICGPANNWDTRFYASGDTVFAGDGSGGIWMSPTAGEGPYSDQIIFSESPLRFFNNQCATAKTSLFLTDPSNCEAFRTEVLEVTLSGSKNFVLNAKDTFPRLLAKNEAIYVTYLPSTTLHDTGFLYLKYERNDKTYDTTILLLGEHVNSYGVVVSPTVFKTLVQTPCQILDTTITIRNLPCDTVRIADAFFQKPGFLSVLSPSFPVLLPPDSEITIHVSGKATAKGLFSDTLFLVFKYKDSSFLSKIPVTFTVYKDIEARPEIAPSALSYGYVSVCSPSIKRLYLRNVTCEPYDITSIRPVNSDIEFTITKMPALPLTLAPGGLDSIEVTFAPKISGSYAGRITFTISFRDKVYDTTIIMGGMGTTGVAAIFTDSLLNFDSLYSCESRTLETSIQNIACSQAKLVRFLNANPQDYQILSPQLPVWIDPGARQKIVVELKSARTGSKPDILNAFLESQGGGTQDFPIPLAGFIRSDIRPITLSASSIVMDSISVCSSSDTGITFGNIEHCDSIQVDSAWLSGDPDLSISKYSKSILIPNENSTIGIHFAPESAGRRKATLHVKYSHNSVPADTSVDISASSIGLARLLSASVQSCDFGSTTICDERDTTITLYNSGCDSLVITSGFITGSGFSLSGGEIPLTLGPKEKRTLTLRTNIDTSGAKALNSGFLILEGNSDSTLPAIPLSRTIIYPRKIDVTIRQDDYKGGSPTSYRLFAQGLNGVRTIDFDLGYNTDLLTYRNSAGMQPITSSDGKHFQILGNPFVTAGTDGSIGQLLFDVFLAKDTTTSLVLSNIHLNADDPQFEQCLGTATSGSSAPFTYIFGCGDQMYLDFLRHKQLIRIGSITPDPARDGIQIAVESPVATEVRLEIIDALGVSVYSSAIPVSQGLSSLRLATQGFPAGAYHVRIRSEYGVASASFIKVD
ncbi:MAG: hypothetical protein Q8896_03030 [Bacteroidota bacterium]|nr:hypothetical protein [Bacteroidota bacterium]